MPRNPSAPKDTDSSAANPLWQQHEGRLKESEDTIRKLSSTVYGPDDKHSGSGLEKRVEHLENRVQELEKGFWRKFLSWFKSMVVFLGIIAAAVLAFIADALELWEWGARVFSSNGKN